MSRLTLGRRMTGQRFGAAAFDLTTLAWSGLWLPNYSPTSWAGTASAGGSGSRALAEATHSPPSIVDGSVTIPDFAGTTKFLANATNVATLLGTTGYYVFVVARVDAIDTNPTSASIHTSDALLSDTTGRWHIGLRSGGGSPDVHLMHWDGVSPSIRPFAPTGLPLAQMCLIEGWWDGVTTISCAVNGGTPATATVAGTITAPGTLRMGRNYNTSYADGQIWGAGLLPSAPDAALRLNVATALRTLSGYALA